MSVAGGGGGGGGAGGKGRGRRRGKEENFANKMFARSYNKCDNFAVVITLCMLGIFNAEKLCRKHP